MLARIITAGPIVALGYNVSAVAAFTAFTTFYAITLHANLRWTYGPLRYAIASPAFHRWHHTCAVEGQDKNFAGFLPVWDLMFGTFHMPRGRQPELFGVADPVPGGLIGQLVYPFRRKRRDGRPIPGRAGEVRVLPR
jgi:sterol desaturase/sphingolipid hydroxylase (fatty acid hydroxylase superfamily)